MPLDELNNPELTATADWPPIDRRLLGEARPTALPSFPLHVLPGRFRTWAEAASRPLGGADYLAQCLLGAVAGVCGAGVRVGVASHWSEPLILWQALIGGPSSGKSAAFARTRGLLAQLKPWPEEGAESFDEGEGVPRVLVNARLTQLDTALFSSVRGVLLWRDDLADWMAGAQKHKTRHSWLAAWNAGPARISFGQQEIFAVGIAGALAPERLASPGNAQGFVDGDSALAARFLFCWPQAGRLPSLAGEEADDEGLVALLQKIANFASHRERPSSVTLDAPVHSRLEALMAELRELGEQADGVEAEWIAKGVPTIVRLAGLLAVMQWAEDEESIQGVGLAQIEAAYAVWSGYYLPHARAVFDRAGIAGCERAARRVARWLRRVRSPEISREDIRRQALCQTVNAEGAEDVLARLEAGGVLRQISSSGSAKGGPRPRRWAVHPEIASWRS